MGTPELEKRKHTTTTGEKKGPNAVVVRRAKVQDD